MTTGDPQNPLYDPTTGSKETMPGDNQNLPYYPGSSGAGEGARGPADFINGVGNYLKGIDWQTLQGSGIDPYLLQRLGLIASAYNMFDAAGDYKKTGDYWANRADPAGDRSYYKNYLKSSYDDPMAFLSNPEHKAIQERQMNILQGRTRAGGYMGSGKEMMDLSDYLAQSDAQYLTQQRQLLGNLAGYQFNPADAARIAMQGQDQSIKTRTNALGMIGQAISPVERQVGQGGGGAGSGGGYGGMTGSQAAAAVAQLIKSNPQLAKIDPRTGISFAAGITKGYYGDQGGSGGYGGGGTGIDPTNPVDYNIMNRGGYGSTSGGGGYEGEGTGIDPSTTNYTDPSYWESYFKDLGGDY